MKKSCFVMLLAIFSFAAVFANGKSDAKAGKGNEDPNYPITLSVFTQASRQQPNPDNKMYEYLEEKLNVKFEWDILVGEIAQKRGVMIAGGDYPDLIQIGETQFIDAGACIPLEDLIDEYGPNIKKFFGEDYESLRWEDGHIYYLTNWGIYQGKNQNPDYNASALWLQKEVLKEAGYPEVKTMDQYFDVLTAYADKHPTINGQPTIPFTILTYDWHAFCMWNPPEFLAGFPNDGNGVVDPETQKYQVFFPADISKKWFKKLNGLNAEGYIDKGAFTDNYDQYLAKLSSGRVLGMHDQGWQFQNAKDSLRDQGMYNRTWAPLPIVFDESIRPHYRDWPEPNLGRGVAISVNAEDPVRIIRFLNDFLAEDVQRTMEWGIEGEDWQFDEKGVPYRTDEQRQKWDNATWQEQNRALIVRDMFPTAEGSFSGGYPTDLKFFYPERKATLEPEDIDLWEAYGVTSDAEFVDPNPPANPIWYPAWNMPNPPDGSDAQIALQRCEQVMRKYLPQVIMAPPAQFESLWAEYVQQMDENGIDVYQAYMQEQLDKRITARTR
jgi:putative aldouronate transport system substrate-binding protein